MIILDAMGSDGAPGPEVEGSLIAKREWSLPVTLVGHQEKLQEALKASGSPESLWPEIVHAETVVTMEDSPIAALRGKRDSSLRKSVDLIKEGKGKALVSMGNTGAVMATAKIVLGMVDGIDRPALATWVPAVNDQDALLLDVGANVECKPTNLVQFAQMGVVLYQLASGNETPSVGLLNIGSEERKGTELTKETHALLSKLDLNYIGHVEPVDIFQGKVNVIVTDGWSGNVVLKTAEGVFEALKGVMATSFKKNPVRMVGASMSRGVFRDLKDKFDYSRYGGVPLLGVAGVTVIGHGRSNGWAVANALRVAEETSRGDLPERTAKRLAESRAAAEAS